MGWLRFNDTTPENWVTHRWDVFNKNSGLLGQIKWYPYWRKYCLFTAEGIVFDEGCLREVAEFLESKNREHKAAKKGV